MQGGKALATEKVEFTLKNEEGTDVQVEFYILDQTRINGKDYLLVTEPDTSATMMITLGRLRYWVWT